MGGPVPLLVDTFTFQTISRHMSTPERRQGLFRPDYRHKIRPISLKQISEIHDVFRKIILRYHYYEDNDYLAF